MVSWNDRQTVSLNTNMVANLCILFLNVISIHIHYMFNLWQRTSKAFKVSVKMMKIVFSATTTILRKWVSDLFSNGLSYKRQQPCNTSSNQRQKKQISRKQPTKKRNINKLNDHDIPIYKMSRSLLSCKI